MTNDAHNLRLIVLAFIAAGISLTVTLSIAPRLMRFVSVLRQLPGWKNLTGIQRGNEYLVHFGAFWIGLSLGIVAIFAWGKPLGFHWNNWYLFNELLSAAWMTCALGLIHDLFKIRPHLLFAGQLLVCLIVISSDLIIRGIVIDGVVGEFATYSVPVTLAWLMFSMNALWFVERELKISGLVAVIIGLTLATTANWLISTEAVLFTCVFVGSLAGWLIHQHGKQMPMRHRSVSMHWGIILGLLTPHLFSVSDTNAEYIQLSRSISIWALPVLIALLHAAMKSISSTRNANTRVTPVIQADAIPEEPKGAADRALQGGSVNRLEKSSTYARGRSRGSHNWDALWETLCACADRQDLSSVEMQIDLPSDDEFFHKVRMKRTHPRRSEIWQLEFPLRLGEKQIGRIYLIGDAQHEMLSVRMSRVIEGLRPFEIHFLAVLEAHTHLPDSLVTPPPLSLRMNSTMIEQVALQETSRLRQAEMPESADEVAR